MKGPTCGSGIAASFNNAANVCFDNAGNKVKEGSVLMVSKGVPSDRTGSGRSPAQGSSRRAIPI